MGADADQGDRQTLLDSDDARYFLTRSGFAPDERTLASYVGLSREQAVDKLLATARTTPVTPMPAWVDEPIPTRAEERALDPQARRAEGAERGRRYEALRGWWIHEMATRPSPLTERMTLFWHGHFTSGQDKVPYPQLMARQNALLRRYALGSFADMLHAVAKDPAMLMYLDGAGNRKGHPNENFAREVMELFTLGEGHYGQRDVSEAARAYTGWSLDPDTRAYVWRADWHDAGEKTVLGHTGAFDGDAVLDLLLAQPQTATFIVTELWREFVSETPDPAQIERIAARFRSSGYDIAVALRGLFSTDAFWDVRNRGVLVKSPAQFVVGALRSFDVDDDDMTPLAGTLRNLGQNLFAPPNVKGWPGGSTWINSTTLLAREQFVEQLFRSTGPNRAKAKANANANAKGMPPPSMSGSAAKGASTMTAMRDMAGERMAASMRPASAPGNAMRAQHGMRFDLDGWLARYGTAPTERSGLSIELQLQHAVLPISPVDPIDTGTSSSAYLRALLMDPAYQLD
ncbi:DUF1800 domain-containing protein [Trinickia dinghuensis]|uniref:DUF1800 domain-containing protein n=1 Tax=Trinickia dinghuensis TaxID=2291023 RepID=A0A3D8K1R9_9BURK|nr:DUF1800 domain-containing protein [Trinickia dinghuensis]RDU99407.1 DUF1800 domain-containing protein [Trinickia dinghuensis]